MEQAGAPAKTITAESPAPNKPSDKATAPVADAGNAQGNIPVCERFYRSFRASDCTYQPYSGPRRYCGL